MKRIVFLLTPFLLILSSCKKDGEVAYSTYYSGRAKFTLENVQQAPVLQRACESAGEFCTITVPLSGQTFLFRNAAGNTSQVNISAISAYGGYYLGINGFILGLPTIPEIGADVAKVVCYDLACPNCYTETHIAKSLTMQPSSMVYCANCKRTYNLNDYGLVASGTAGRSLFRYRVSYINYVLVINNG